MSQSQQQQNSRRPPPTKQFRQLKFGTINITTVREHSRLDDCVRLASSANLDIVALQETKRRGVEAKTVRRTENGKQVVYEFYGRGYKRAPPKDESLAGVGFLVRKSQFITVEDVNDDLGPRMLSATILAFGIRYFMINNYMFTETASRPVGLSAVDYAKKVDSIAKKKDRQYQLLRKTIKDRPKKARLIVLGDFNATSTVASSYTRHRGNNPISDAHTANDNGTRMLDVVRQI